MTATQVKKLELKLAHKKLQYELRESLKWNRVTAKQ